MGSAQSSDCNEDIWDKSEQNLNLDPTAKYNTTQNFDELKSYVEQTRARNLSRAHSEHLNSFKLQLAEQHKKRSHILEVKSKEMEDLKEEIIRLRKENHELKEVTSGTSCSKEPEVIIKRLQNENEELRSALKEKNRLLENCEVFIDKNSEHHSNITQMQKELHKLNTECLNFDKERQDYQTHIQALKDVIGVSKQMLGIRECQLRELQQKEDTIQESLADREMYILSENLKYEYERQLQNIRNLKTLYEERQRAEQREKEELASELEVAKNDIRMEQNKIRDFEERVKELETDNSKKYDEIKTLESNLGLSNAEKRQYQAELSVINQLFSNILLSFNPSQNIDLDKLQKRLEDHHEILHDIISKELSSEISYALPKVFLELLNHVDTREGPLEKTDEKLESISEEPETQGYNIQPIKSAEEIIENLPKVWRVLIELLSHQKPPTNKLTESTENKNPCYKTVQTPSGPSLVLSVSQTFIRLKDLILEKKCLEKDTNHLKHLNSHLEIRLQDQEKRLELVESELSKTWHMVGTLQQEHQMLHTQEKILRYELAEKRKLLTQLKEELKYSREKSLQAREKNTNTEQLWRELRAEFTSRRDRILNFDVNSSVESGYSDDRECLSSDEDPEYPPKYSCAEETEAFIKTDKKNEDDKHNDSAIFNLIQSEIKEIINPPVQEQPCSTEVHPLEQPNGNNSLEEIKSRHCTNVNEDFVLEKPSTSHDQK